MTARTANVTKREKGPEV